ncbi:fibronectin type III domain-containing protein [Nocardioides marmorisolisilvae]|uniref:fibronectin type III domain-containing protein n=1 Tax=Nocardioides marmorisolisilvae TaxID=1542737 RepID=UPI001610E3FF|nr:fibronectin type III domain-containing protein [Nocardioides marmorisolisilvae]
MPTAQSWLTADEMAKPHARLAQQADASQAAVDAALSLHSRSSSSKKIYLDFDGFNVAAGTAWASTISTGNKGGFSLDGSANPGFTQTELDYITKVWTIVAEKYSPFDLDVTTENQSDDALTRTSAGDTAYGTHVVFTDDQTARPSGCGVAGCAGIAWVGVFDNVETLNKYEPAWVYTTLNFGSGDVQQTAGQAANSAAHEVGHTLGLHHDVTNAQPSGYYGGHDIWSPIMGSSSRAVQQFDDNGYPDAATPGQVDPTDGTTADPDDFDVMTKSGISYRPDTEGGALGAPYTADGVITTDADTDTYTVNRSACTGAVTVAATGIGMGQTLDLKLTIGGPSGTLTDSPTTGSVSTLPNTPTGMDASVNVPSASSGTMSIQVEGVGDATSGYSGYGSVGQYHLAVTGCQSSGAIAPTAPTSVTTTPNAHTTTGSVSWSPPNDPGTSPVTSYTVSGVPGGPYVVNAPTTSKSLTGLNPGTTYTVGVTASSNDGTSPAATKSLRVATWAPTATPGLTLTPHKSSVDVAWTAPSNPGNAIPTGWHVTLYSASHVALLTAPETLATTGTTITGLSPGSYSVEVYQDATSDDGTKSATASKSFKTLTAPSAPKIGTAASGASGGAVNALARWGAPSSTGGSAITGYRVYAYKLSSKGTVVSSKYSAMLGASTRSYRFTLSAGTYRFRVAAYNAVGKSSYSAYSAKVSAR